jgi:hypothetical protein
VFLALIMVSATLATLNKETETRSMKNLLRPPNSEYEPCASSYVLVLHAPPDLLGRSLRSVTAPSRV